MTFKNKPGPYEKAYLERGRQVVQALTKEHMDRLDFIYKARKLNRVHKLGGRGA
jgi:hypothetical protein